MPSLEGRTVEAGSPLVLAAGGYSFVELPAADIAVCE
jgi:hypothetical protein